MILLFFWVLFLFLFMFNAVLRLLAAPCSSLSSLICRDHYVQICSACISNFRDQLKSAATLHITWGVSSTQWSEKRLTWTSRSRTECPSFVTNHQMQSANISIKWIDSSFKAAYFKCCSAKGKFVVFTG